MLRIRRKSVTLSQLYGEKVLRIRRKSVTDGRNKKARAPSVYKALRALTKTHVYNM